MKKTTSLVLTLIILFTFTACSNTTAASAKPTASVALVADDTDASPTPHSTGKIFLYGATRKDKIELDKEFEAWSDHYQNDNMRHLFIYNTYYYAEFLNEWMQSNNDDILNVLFKDIKNTADYQEFLKKIKRECPETVFHGTGVNLQYDTIGANYIKYLEDSMMAGLENYKLAQEAIEQGKTFYNNGSYDWAYRENTMAENFTREFDKLNGEAVMGIYGADQANIDAVDSHTHTVLSMAGQLKAVYGNAVHSEDIRNTKPIRTDIITVGSKDYDASYFGKVDVGGDTYVSMEFWRLENAYNDFQYSKKTGINLDDSYYPFKIDKGQVFIIEWIKKDGTADRTYYLYDGYVWNGMKITKEFTVN